MSELAANLTDVEFEWEIVVFLWPNELELASVAFFAVLFVIGLVGNSMVVFVVIRNQSMRTATNIFLVNLACADLLVLLLCLPSTVYWEITKTWWFGTSMCKATMFFQNLSITVSILTLVSISVERWYAICNPLRFRVTFRWTRNLLTLVWTTGVFLSLPEPITVSAQPFDWNRPNFSTPWGTNCKDNWGDTTQQYYQLAQTTVLFVIPLLMISCVYGHIVYVLWVKSCQSSDSSANPSGTFSIRRSKASNVKKSATAMLTEGGESQAARIQAQSRRKAAKMLIAVVILFAVCYLPIHLHNIANAFKITPFTSTSPYFIALNKFVVRSLSYTASVANPVLYNFMSEKFQREFRRACCVTSKNSPFLDRVQATLVHRRSKRSYFSPKNCTEQRQQLFDLAQNTARSSENTATNL